MLGSGGAVRPGLGGGWDHVVYVDPDPAVARARAGAAMPREAVEETSPRATTPACALYAAECDPVAEPPW